MYKVDKASMLPAVMRNDPCLAARPDMRRSMEQWWGGSLWDPRDPSSGEFFGSDFTCGSSMRDVLAALRLSDGESERLALAVAEGDLVEAERLLVASADVTPALHLALQIGAAPETVELLAACCSRLNVWLPEPAVVTWARATCRAALSGRPLRGATAKLDSLLLAGADVNSIGRGCETALHILARTLQLLWQESQRYSLRSKSLSREIQEHPSDKNVFEGSAVTAFSLRSTWRRSRSSINFGMTSSHEAQMRAWPMVRALLRLKGCLRHSARISWSPNGGHMPCDAITMPGRQH
ncbi:unnamed protein product [Symbiodinium necroappetens]|uniref:Uncharacterized protein n=1 Tax=Symbiodinium necroappetens TaxID=1628268 RepID=A0A812RQ97_9DINO|nr:unnamed protein product [Symbiodinium necroappetens]